MKNVAQSGHDQLNEGEEGGAEKHAKCAADLSHQALHIIRVIVLNDSHKGCLELCKRIILNELIGLITLQVSFTFKVTLACWPSVYHLVLKSMLYAVLEQPSRSGQVPSGTEVYKDI